MRRAGFYMIVGFLVASACQKEQSLVQTPLLDSDKPKLLWRERFQNLPTSMEIDPHVFNGNVIFGCQRCPEASIRLHNGATGEILSEWANWQTTPSEFLATEFSSLIQNHLVVSAGREWVSIDMAANTQNWSMVKTNQAVNPMQVYSDGQYAYTTARFNFNNNGTTSQGAIIKSQPDVFQLDTVYSYVSTDHYRPWFIGLAFSHLSNGNQVVIFKNRAYSTIIPFPNAGRLDVFAYDLTADSLLWSIQGVESHEGGVLPIRTLGNLAFVPGHMYIHCFDVETGQKLWDYRVDKALFLGDLVVHNNTLIVKGANDELFCLDPYTGQRIWGVRNAGYGPKARLTIFNNKIFYTGDGYLRVASALDGRELYSSKGELWDQQGPLMCTPAIDPVNRRIFINNSTFAICLQMPEDW